MTKKEKIRLILSEMETRIKYLEKDLYLFGRYYFPTFFRSKSAPFHARWIKSMQSPKNTGIKWFRESGKTIWLTIYYAHCIAYRTRKFITHYCFEWGASEARLFDLVLQLQTNERIIEDFWMLYPSFAKRNSAKQKAGIAEFVTTNAVRVKAMSIWQSPRGLVFVCSDGAYRPDLIGLDDIDVAKSVHNPKIIDKNYAFVKSEIIGGMSDGAKVVMLGNVIKEDGVIPRMEQAHANDPDWHIFKQAIKDPDGSIAWPERYCETDAEAAETGKMSLETKLRSQWSTAYAQNFLLIPAMEGDTVIKREFVRYGETELADRVVIGVDPAFSEKSFSDNFAIVVTAHVWNTKYVRACYALKWNEKDYAKAIDFVFKLYGETWANVVNFESVAFQTVLAKLAREKWMAVKEVRPHADKVTRLMEYQADFERGDVVFDPDGPGIPELIEELLAFPNAQHDDRVDALMYSMLKSSAAPQWAVL